MEVIPFWIYQNNPEAWKQYSTLALVRHFGTEVLSNYRKLRTTKSVELQRETVGFYLVILAIFSDSSHRRIRWLHMSNYWEWPPLKCRTTGRKLPRDQTENITNLRECRTKKCRTSARVLYFVFAFSIKFILSVCKKKMHRRSIFFILFYLIVSSLFLWPTKTILINRLKSVVK